MPETRRVDITEIVLDLANPRTVQQPNEESALETMISINPSKFWGLMDSIIDDGYHPTENIVLLKNRHNILSIKEGNRRVAVLKILLGLLQYQDIPQHITDKILLINEEWKEQNRALPCVIYTEEEVDIADKIVSLVHAKGEPASRDGWTAVAKTRYDRDKKGVYSASLELLESYLKKGKNLSQQQAERWSGDYYITVLDEALPKIAKALNQTTLAIVQSYPKKNKRILDNLLLDIGVGNIGFREVRDKNNFFGERYGLTQTGQPPSPILKPAPPDNTTPADGATPPSDEPQRNNPQAKPRKAKSLPLQNAQSVSRKLKAFAPKGYNREKVVTLLEELKQLNIDNHPHAFCFILRSLFEISAKIYSTENKLLVDIKTTDKNGNERRLVDILRDITNHITSNNTDKIKVKIMHGALTEISKKEGLLSVTSMNQLVHNPNFSISTGDICLLFHNIFPLLEEMHQ